jgi:hypothetical protein
MHTHEISTKMFDGVPVLDSATRDEIHHLTSLGCRAGQIHLRLGLPMSGEMLWNFLILK